jgi:hypothetical protein
MKTMKALSLVMALLLIVGCVCACGSSGQGFSSRVVQITTPLKEPLYAEATIGNYDSVDPLHKHSEFIFKGRIDKVKEVQISWQTTSKSNIVHDWRSSCEVTIENVIYGEVPGIKDKIKVVFIASSRMALRDTFDLTEGQEYYFLTHIYTEAEKNRATDPIKTYQFGDVGGSNIFHLLPVSDGIVSFRTGWPFVGAQHPVVTEENFDTLGGMTATIDEKSFLKQFMAMIQDAKSTFVPETSAPQSTASVVD